MTVMRKHSKLCLNCGVRPAQRIIPYGYMPCKICTARHKKYKVGETIEITTEAIREGRKEYRDDVLQRMRGNTASLEYIKKYGKKGFTKEQIREARNVWGEYYSDTNERFDKKI